MTRPAPPTTAPRSLRARADLLHGLWLAEQHHHAPQQLAAAAGFVLETPLLQEPGQESHEVGAVAAGAGAVARPVVDKAAALPAPNPPDPPATGPAWPAHQWGVLERVTLPSQASTADADDGALPLQLSDLQGQGQPAPLLPLVPPARLLPALKRSLPSMRQGGLDLPALLARLATGQPLRRLPRRRHCGWAQRVLLVLDFSEALLPYHADMLALARLLLRWLGPGQLQVRQLEDSAYPLGPWRVWPEPEPDLEPDLAGGPGQFGTQQAGTQQAASQQPDGLRTDWQVGAAQVLLLGDVGLSGADCGQRASAWGQWCQTLLRGGAQLEVWCPVALAGAGLPRLPVVHWRPGSPLRAQPLAPAGGHATPARRALAQQLLAALAAAAFIEPGLLRAMRHGMAWALPGTTPGWNNWLGKTRP